MIPTAQRPYYQGILLAAGKGNRFDPTGTCNKLLQKLRSGDSVVAASARHLHTAIGSVLAVIPTGSPVLTAHLSAAGFDVTKCAMAANGMAASLVHGVQASQDADGWVIALGD